MDVSAAIGNKHLVDVSAATGNKHLVDVSAATGNKHLMDVSAATGIKNWRMLVLPQEINDELTISGRWHQFD